MKPIEFKEQNVVYGKDQNEYLPLPSLRRDDGEVVTCWKLTWKEVIKLLFTRKVWLSLLTFNSPLQPMFVTINKSDVITSGKDK